MELTSAAVAVALLLAAQLSAAVASVPVPIGQPNCSTTCGGVSVPYPFGFGPAHCYCPGFNLTCDTSSPGRPRLLLGDGTLRVANISLDDNTVRVMRNGSIVNTTGDFTSNGWSASFGGGFKEYGYKLSSRNDLVVYGCNVLATLLADVGERTPRIVGSCSTSCTKFDGDQGFTIFRGDEMDVSNGKHCTGTSRCCRAPLNMRNTPTRVQVRWIYSGNHTVEQEEAPVNVFVAEEGWVDQTGVMRADKLEEVPLVLDWSVKLDPPPLQECPGNVSRMLCKKSEHSVCSALDEGYVCSCQDGYIGNPYIAGGCRGVHECKLPIEANWCFGECINTIASFECRCPTGTFGNPYVRDACVKTNSTTDALQLGMAPAQIGLPNCNTTCGDVRVPFPFGFGPSRCYWPGFKLRCDTSLNPPRLLLGDNSTVQVVDIFLTDSTVRVIHAGTLLGDDVQFPDISETYMLSPIRNEFIVAGCDVEATLLAKDSNSSRTNSTNNNVISSCVSTCSSGVTGYPMHTSGKYCSGRDGCCHAPINTGSTPMEITFKDLRGPNSMIASHLAAFVAEEEQIDQWYTIFNKSVDDRYYKRSNDGFTTHRYMASEMPLILLWAVKQGIRAPADHSGATCPGDVARRVCKSDHSDCRQENGGYTCYCNRGYYGNPYITHGCQDIDECKIPAVRNACFGDCNNFPGSYECRCPRGRHGNASQPNGCDRSVTGLIVGTTVGSVAGSILLVLIVIFMSQRIKYMRATKLKQKHFKQNRGQLLQQLVSQNADIAEKMIILVDELAKATNNFDRARELGGGGHGTVYKGILSDLHVVAIKKPKRAVQEEIDEFINEVAILSQINHRNIVKLFGCCLETKVPLLVYEFISNGTLYHHLHVEGPRSLSWGTRLRIATEISKAIAYLHSSVSIPIIHRDIKSSNILLDDTLTSKVSDFGASRYIPRDRTGLTTRVQGTIGYLDPMYFHTGRLNKKSDVYSFGVILVELLTRKKPFLYLSSDGDGLVMHFTNSLAEGNLAQILDPQLTEEGGQEVEEVATLAASCIKLSGDDRPTMRQVEITLEGLQASNVRGSIVMNLPSTEERQSLEESTRRYSMEQELLISARYPR